MSRKFKLDELKEIIQNYSKFSLGDDFELKEIKIIKIMADAVAAVGFELKEPSGASLH